MLQSSSQNVGLSFGIYVCCAIFVLGLAIPTVYFGHLDEDSTCQHGTRAGMVLSDWVKVSGWSAIAYSIAVPIVIGISKLVKTPVHYFVISFITVIDLLFWISWWIIGVVILSTNENNSCVAEGKGMAVMAILQLIFGKSRFLYGLILYAIDTE